VAAPVAAAAFGLAPVAVGALGLYRGETSAISGVNNLQQGHNWSAAFDFANAGMAFAPMATKGGRNALFGEEAIAQTSKTVNTIADKGGQALNGAKTWFGGQPPSQPAFAMAGSGQRPRLTPSSMSSIEPQQPMMMQGNPQGSVPQGASPKVPTTLKESISTVAAPKTVPKISVSEPDVGLSNRGYQPKPGERSMTKEQWKAQSSEQRAQNTTSKTDQPLENPRANAAQEGHGHSDHGYQTTDTQHGDRIRTRVTPSGRVGKPVSKSSKFNSPQSEAEAAGRGRTALEKDLANGNIVDTYPDPVTGKPTYIDPATGAPTRHTVSVTTNKPDGFGYKIVKQKDASGNVLRDASNQPLTTADPTPVRNATVAWEYVPSKGEWHIVTHYPN
jgi:hypothetical protein